jgi:hypothetical protein
MSQEYADTIYCDICKTEIDCPEDEIPEGWTE